MLLTQHTASNKLLEGEGKVDGFLTNLVYLQASKPLENLVNLSHGH